MYLLLSILELALPALVIGSTFHLLQFRWRGQPLHTYLNSRWLLYTFLLTWIILGWISGWETTHQKAYNINLMYPSQKIADFLLIGASLLLIMSAYFIPNKRLAFTLLIIELSLWLFKLFFIKGGYLSGAAASLDSGVIIYDSISLILRLLFLKTVTHMLVYPRTIFIFAGILMFFKLWLFRGF